MKSIAQQADEILDKFKPYADTNLIDGYYIDKVLECKNATHIAIIHVKGILEELLHLYSDLSHNAYSRAAVRDQVKKYETILSELKSRL